MRKRATTCDNDQLVETPLKIPKLQSVNTPKRKELYAFNQNSFKEFPTPITRTFCLHTTEPLIAIASFRSLPRTPMQSVIRIYTLDGDKVTIFESPAAEEIHLSDTMVITSEVSLIPPSYDNLTLTRYNDLSVIDATLHVSSFDCDRNGNIYVLPNVLKNTNIDIYSPDLKYVGPFIYLGYNSIRSIKIHEDFIVILSDMLYHKNEFKMSRCSLSGGELLQTVHLNRCFFPNPSFYLSFDPLSNLLISSDRLEDIAVWYLNSGIQYHKADGDSAFNRSIAIGAEMTKNFQFIRAMSNGSIRLYDGITVTLV